MSRSLHTYELRWQAAVADLENYHGHSRRAELEERVADRRSEFDRARWRHRCWLAHCQRDMDQDLAALHARYAAGRCP
jgi:hypothetical protein